MGSAPGLSGSGHSEPVRQNSHAATAVGYGDMPTQIAAQPEFFAGWGTLALVNAGLAQGKNRSGLAWFLISLVTGPYRDVLPRRTFRQAAAGDVGST